MTIEKLINEVERKFEILLAISIFFPVLMTTYYDIGGGSLKEKHDVFVFFSLVGIYIGSYVFFQISKLFPLRWVLHILNWALLAAIASFAMPTLMTIVAKNPINMSWFAYQVNTLTFIGSMIGISTLPFAILYFTSASILFGILAPTFKKLWANIKGY